VVVSHNGFFSSVVYVCLPFTFKLFTRLAFNTNRKSTIPVWLVYGRLRLPPAATMRISFFGKLALSECAPGSILKNVKACIE
jgi:hypothetical protein